MFRKRPEKDHDKSPLRRRVRVHGERRFQPAPGARPGANPGPGEAGEGGGGLAAAGWSSRPLPAGLVHGETAWRHRAELLSRSEPF